MKITHIVASLGGGSGIGARRYHQALLAAGVSSRILVAGPCDQSTPEIQGLVPHKSPLSARVLRRLGLPGESFDRWTARIRAAEKDGPPRAYELFSLPCGPYHPELHPWLAEPGIINLHWIAGALDLPRFLRAVRQPVIVTLHDQHPYLGGFHYARDLARAPHLSPLESELIEVKKHAYASATIGVIGNSLWNTAAARDSRVFPRATPFDTVYLPLEGFRPWEKPGAREALHLDADHLVIGFACDGLANHRKGFDLALAALHRLPPGITSRSILLTFGGNGQNPVLPVPSMHLGYLTDTERKALAYSAMDVFIAPSRAEAFGLTALEALACGTPVVATDVGGLAEAVDHGRAGLLCPPEDAASLAEAVGRILADADLAARLIASGLDLVRTRHTLSAAGHRYAAFAASLLPAPATA